MNTETQSLREVALTGTAVSRGLAHGRAVRLRGSKMQFFGVTIAPEDHEKEIVRLQNSLEHTKIDLRNLAGTESPLPPESRSIFDAQLLILEHSSFAGDVENTIRTQLVNAEWAITRVAETLTNKFRVAADRHIREKYLDLQDVAERMLNALSPAEPVDSSLWTDAIIVASAISPSTMVELSRCRPRAIVTEHGGWTSHAFIMAREMDIPAVTGLRDLCRNVLDGDQILVDGYSGRVVVRPREDTVVAAKSSAASYHLGFQKDEDVSKPLATVDGREITIRANVEKFASADELYQKGADGIGLLRSEYLFDQKNGRFPSEDDQYRAYRDVADRSSDQVVRIRTFDLNAEQLRLGVVERDKNPSLGLKAIRLSLADDAHLRSQVRAIIRAREPAPFDIILPMVSGTEEILRSRDIIASENEAIRGIEAALPKVGVMIEVPSAVILIDEILKIVDLVCIGTNDLVQYLLAVDRDNESVADWYQTLHPAVIRAIRSVLRASAAADVPAVVCGEMAGSPFYTPLLIGLGAREFSMNLNSVAAVRRVVNGISYDECVRLAALAERSTSSADTEITLKQYYRAKWPHFFPTNNTEK
ncbi:MAG: phosphoenolpyruvate--protein phosphotransferase [Acidobacteriota bacterium]